MNSIQTHLLPDDVESPELAYALRASLGNSETESQELVDERFREAISDVIRGIQNHGKFDFLKRFIAHGSLLPSWEKKFKNTPRALNDDELASFVDFVSGHMVSKFQGRLAEILSATALSRLVGELEAKGSIPKGATLIINREIRCLPRRKNTRQSLEDPKGIQGPDGLIVTFEPDGCINVDGIIEVKSMYVNPSSLEKQFTSHFAAVRRGVKIGKDWFQVFRPPAGITGGTGSRAAERILVRIADWLLIDQFQFEPTGNGNRQLVMEDQELPLTQDPWAWDEKNGWYVVTLTWSYDALRAAAFCLAHRYMAEVGEALEKDPDPDVPLRSDMLPQQAGPNDLLAQLHVAIFRQEDTEPNAERRRKTIELYNVLGFGWALGHNYRDASGKPDIMYPEDLDQLLEERANERS